MDPFDLPPDQLRRWMSSAPRALLQLVLEQLLVTDSETLKRVVKDAWEAFLRTPDRRQQAEIRTAVADALRRRFNLTDVDADRCAGALLGPEMGPPEAGRSAAPSPLAWRQVSDAVLSVDVLYEQTEGGGRDAWKRLTRVFLRDEAGVRQISQDAALRWEDLPSDVRDACIKGAQSQQRFVLYPAASATGS